MVTCALLFAAGIGGCSSREALTEWKDPTEALPARFKSTEPVPVPDFSQRAQSQEFAQAVQKAAKLLGIEPQPLRLEDGQVPGVAGCYAFEVDAMKLETSLLRAHKDFLAEGFYLCRYDQNFGIGGKPDRVALLPTADKYEVIATMGTSAGNYGIGTAGVIAWLKELEREHPFVLSGIGFDYLEGEFRMPPDDPQAMAERMYEFCPDIVDQGTETVANLATELRAGRLYFWWD
jgi:hypothetical protein